MLAGLSIDLRQPKLATSPPLQTDSGKARDAMDQTHLPQPTLNLPPRRLSQVLCELAASSDGPVAIETIRDALADRSFAALLAVFAAINLLPLPPGSSAILGIPLVIVSAQMLLGRGEAWLPAFILRKKISRGHFDYAIRKLVPWLQRLERFVRPRYWPIPRAQTDRVIGLIAFILAVAVTVPIPLGNWLPAFASAIIALALSERDGVLLGAGFTLGALSLAVIFSVVGAAGAAAGWIYHAFG